MPLLCLQPADPHKLWRAAEPNIGNGADYEKYSWVQTLKDANATFQMPKGTKGRDCDVQITAKSLRVGVKGQPPIVDGPLFETIKVPSPCVHPWLLPACC